MNSENKNEKKGKRTIFAKLFNFIYFFVFIFIIIPIILISCIIIYKGIRYPDKIPDVLGYKMFFILDDFMDESVGYGDLIFTKNIDPDTLNSGDLIAFRNRFNLVTLHQIISIENKTETRRFTFQTLANETDDTRYATSENVEGLLIKIIPRIGIYLFFLQSIWGLLATILVIIIFGTIAYMVAAKFDDVENKRINDSPPQNV